MGIAILVGGLLVFLFIGMPIGFSMGISSFIYILYQGRYPLTLIPQRFASGMESFPLLAVPFFILAGQMMNQTGVTTRIFSFANALVGHIKGGLAHVNILASVIFAGMSGTANADVAGLGTIEINAMVEQGYDPAFSAAVTAASSVIGPIIPPSVMLVIYAVITEVSVGRLFLGGIIPGLLIAAALMLMVYFFQSDHDVPIQPRASLAEVGRALRDAALPLLAPVFILGGIFAGVVTPTEAGAVAIAYATVLGFIYREMNLRVLWEVLVDSVKSTAVVMFIIFSASVFGWLVVRENIPQYVSSVILSYTTNPVIVLLLINVFLLILGTLMESVAILVIVAPVLAHMAKAVGIDLVHLGLVVVYNTLIGFITPPVGIGLFVVSDIAEVPVAKVIKATLPFLVPLLVVLLIITYVPATVTWLPNLVYGS